MSFPPQCASLPRMTLKERAHKLIDAMPDDSPSLREICENLALNKAIQEGLDDIAAGRVFSLDEVEAEFQERWKQRRSKSP